MSDSVTADRHVQDAVSELRGGGRVVEAGGTFQDLGRPLGEEVWVVGGNDRKKVANSSSLER